MELKTGKLFGLTPALWITAMLFALGVAQAAESPSVVVHFGKGNAVVSNDEKNKISQVFSQYSLDARARVFVLGYTDSSGGQKDNLVLSRQRAQAVRREIVGAFGVDAAIVTAIGKGAQNPVADNRHADGKVLNRRAEVYLVNARERSPKRVYGVDDPYLGQIQDLVRAADALIRQGRLDQAIGRLQKAHALGGDHYPDWQAAYGIAGYYAHAPMEKTRAHLDRALQLDPHNYTAREFLGRVEARQKVAAGEVSMQMGRDAQTAIAVTAIAQEQEYLRLFGVEPLARRKRDNRALDIWDCRDSNGRPLVYYFDTTGIHSWAFVRQEAPPAVDSPRISLTGPATPSPASVGVRPVSFLTSAPTGGSEKIWESAVFK